MFKILITFLSIFIVTVAFAQNADTFFISGRVISVNSSNPIIGASILLDKNTGTTCDTAGRFIIGRLPQGKYKLSIRSLDYRRKDTVITIEDRSVENLILATSADCKTANRQKALKDLKKGNAFLFVNNKASQSVLTLNKQFKEKYGIGFEFNDFGLPSEDCMSIYNQTIFEHLDNKFGKQWRDEIRVDAIK